MQNAVKVKNLQNFKYIKCVNIYWATEARFLPKESTQNGLPYSRFPLDLTITDATASFVFLAANVATVRSYFQFYQRLTKDEFIETSVTDTGYCIRSRCIQCSELLSFTASNNRRLVNDEV